MVMLETLRESEKKELAIEWFQTKVQEGSHSNFYLSVDKKDPTGYLSTQQSDKTFLIMGRAAGCHASVPSDFNLDYRNGNHIYTFASGYMVNSAPEMAETFWEWITAPNSPWSAITAHGPGTIDPIYNASNRQIGFVFSESVLNDIHIPWNLFKNFCIACRLPMEHPNKLKLWYKLVTEFGLSGADAYLITSCLSAYDKETLIVSPTWTGGHWPVTFDVTKYSSFVRGQITRKKVNYINALWDAEHDASEKYLSKRTYPDRTYDSHMTGLNTILTDEGLIKTTQESKFSSFKGYSIESVVKAFNKWKEDNGHG